MQATTTETESSAIPTGDQKPSTAAPTFEAALYAAIGCTKIDRRSPLRIDEAATQMARFVRSSEEFTDMLEALRQAERILKCDHPNGETVAVVRAAIDRATTPNAHSNHVEQAPVLEAKGA